MKNAVDAHPFPDPSFPTGLISDFQAFLTEHVIMKTLLD